MYFILFFWHLSYTIFMRVLVIIPVFNEAEHLEKVLSEVKELNIFDILVVDDGSQDRSFDIAQSCSVIVLRNEVNRGKGAALKQGFEYALEKGYDSVITMDGDGQHKKEDLLVLYNAAFENGADIILGNRMWQPLDMPWIRKFTNWIMSGTISYLTGYSIPDSQCGLKLIKKNVLQKINLSSQKFEVESEILFQALHKGYSVKSVRISSVYLPEVKSHIRPLRDTFRFLRFLFKNLF